MPLAELDAAILQATITLLVLLLCAGLWIRTRRAWFGWWAVAWGFYLARLMAIGGFRFTRVPIWLYRRTCRRCGCVVPTSRSRRDWARASRPTATGPASWHRT